MSSQLQYAPQDAFGCQRWLGKVDREGYPIVWRGRGRPVGAHRVVYERELGPVPDDKELDHTCRERTCVAPHHLEPVTREENERRKSWRYRARIAACKSGHALATNAVVTPNGGRVCRQCNQDAKREVS